ncbi:hypothetical protein EVAR_34241_1 [Eumeta japonica]|uniref:Uncharacterized protein n=1 Tax=Eumeta variegata TaxID=151549 RepID=A0A4C1WX38_EUMVA|nr:hypothetical protein EVAR_34241_1 [Eumeta japonica]
MMRLLKSVYPIQGSQRRAPTSAACESVSIKSVANALVNKIESADSPYLNLERGNLALTLIPRRNVGGGATTSAPPAKRVPPSAARVQQPVAVQKYTIFKGAGQPTNSELFGAMEAARSRLDTSYDGLGGHSKPDEFPVPRRSRLQLSRGRLPLGDAKRRRDGR